MSGSIHLLPVDDLIEHGADDDCVCGPSLRSRWSKDGATVLIKYHHPLREEQPGGWKVAYCEARNHV